MLEELLIPNPNHNPNHRHTEITRATEGIGFPRESVTLVDLTLAPGAELGGRSLRKILIYT